MNETNKEWEKDLRKLVGAVEFLHGVPVEIPKEDFDKLVIFISQLLSQKDTEWKEKIRNISFIDLYIKYKNDRRFTTIDEILDIGIKEDILQ